MPTLNITVNVTTQFAAVSSNTGVAPLVVHAHARTSTVENNPGGSGGPWEDSDGNFFEDYPAHSLHFVWDFGDALGGDDERFTDPVNGGFVLSNSDQIGPHACHTYTLPGTYTITCTAYYEDPNTGTWLEVDQTATAIEVLTPTEAGWETVYVDPNDTESTGDGTVANPLTSLSELRTKLAEHGNLSVYLATGAVFTAGVDENTLDLTNVQGLRIQRYVPVGSTTATNPKLRLNASNTVGKSVIRVEGNADDNSDDEVQQITITNATAGSFFIRYHYFDAGSGEFTFEDTPNIGYDDLAATIESYLEAISAIGAGNVSVSKPGTSQWDVTFQVTLASTNILQMEVFSSPSDPLLGTGITSTVTTTTNGSPHHVKVGDVVIEQVDLDANNAVSSRCLEVYTAGTAKGYTENFYLRRCVLSTCLSNAVYIEDAMNTAGTFGPQAIGFIRCTFDATYGSGDTVRFACKTYPVFMGCSFRGGAGNASTDDHINFVEFSGNQNQQDVLIRWCGFVASSAKKNFAVFFAGGVKEVSIIGCNFTGVRNAISIDRASSGQLFPTDYIIEGCSFNNLGLSVASEARAIVLARVSNITIRNNLFFENGYAAGAADPVGQDIDINDASGDESSDVGPIRIYHNSFFRSYGKAGAPFIDVDDLRYLHIYSNAMEWLGGVGAGSPPNNPERSLIRFSSTSIVDPQRNEVQLVEITGSPTGGSFKLDFDGQVTTTIAYNATAAQVLAALEGLSNIDVGDVSVTDGPTAGSFLVSFVGDLAGANQSAMTLDTNSLTGGSSPSVSITTLVGGSTGKTFIDGNVYSAPNLLRSGVVKPFVLDGSSFLSFDDATAVNDWRNGGNSYSANVFDTNGQYIVPGFRNPQSGNFKFNSTSPLHDTGVARGVRFDYRRQLRGDTPDVGAFEFGTTGGSVPYVYDPTFLLELPSAEGLNYNDADVRYIEANEPVLVTGDPATDVDNRPHRNLAYRDNVLGSALDALLLDINAACCAPPQTGSEFTSAHTSIESFIRVGHNPDGTLRLTSLDLSGLGFLRTDGGNFMLADLNMGDGNNRLVNMARGESATDGVRRDQVITVQEGGIIFSSAVISAEQGASFNFGLNELTNVGPASAATSAPQLGQVVRKTGDEMTGDLSFLEAIINMNQNQIKDLAPGTDQNDAVNVSQVLLLSGGTMNGLLNMDGHNIDMGGGAIYNLGDGAASETPDAAVRRDKVLLRDGSQKMTGTLKAHSSIDMGNTLISNLAPAVNSGNPMRYDQGVKKAGDTMTGQLTMANGVGINLQAASADELASSGNIIFNCARCIAGHHVANKKYVDDAIEASALSVQGLASTTIVPDTVYQNLTGRTVFVNAGVIASANNRVPVLQISSNGSTWQTVAGAVKGGASGHAYLTTLAAFIPKDWYYRITEFLDTGSYYPSSTPSGGIPAVRFEYLTSLA